MCASGSLSDHRKLSKKRTSPVHGLNAGNLECVWEARSWCNGFVEGVVLWVDAAASALIRRRTATNDGHKLDGPNPILEGEPESSEGNRTIAGRLGVGTPQRDRVVEWSDGRLHRDETIGELLKNVPPARASIKCSPNSGTEWASGALLPRGERAIENLFEGGNDAPSACG